MVFYRPITDRAEIIKRFPTASLPTEKIVGAYVAEENGAFCGKIFAIEPRHGFKAGILHTELMCFCIHLFQKRCNTARYRIGGHIGGIIARLQQHTGNERLHGNRIPGQQSDGSSFHTHHFLCDGNLFLRYPAFKGDERRHNFGCARHGQWVVFISRKQHLMCVSNYQNTRLGGNIRRQIYRPCAQHATAQQQHRKEDTQKTLFTQINHLPYSRICRR